MVSQRELDGLGPPPSLTDATRLHPRDRAEQRRQRIVVVDVPQSTSLQAIPTQTSQNADAEAHPVLYDAAQEATSVPKPVANNRKSKRKFESIGTSNLRRSKRLAQAIEVTLLPHKFRRGENGQEFPVLLPQSPTLLEDSDDDDTAASPAQTPSLQPSEEVEESLASSQQTFSTSSPPSRSLRVPMRVPQLSRPKSAPVSANVQSAARFFGRKISLFSKAAVKSMALCVKTAYLASLTARSETLGL